MDTCVFTRWQVETWKITNIESRFDLESFGESYSDTKNGYKPHKADKNAMKEKK